MLLFRNSACMLISLLVILMAITMTMIWQLRPRALLLSFDINLQHLQQSFVFLILDLNFSKQVINSVINIDT